MASISNNLNNNNNNDNNNNVNFINQKNNNLQNNQNIVNQINIDLPPPVPGRRRRKRSISVTMEQFGGRLRDLGREKISASESGICPQDLRSETIAAVKDVMLSGFNPTLKGNEVNNR